MREFNIDDHDFVSLGLMYQISVESAVLNVMQQIKKVWPKIEAAGTATRIIDVICLAVENKGLVLHKATWDNEIQC